MKKKILIYGAGAIGRGYIPWIFPSEDYKLSFVENNKELREKFQGRNEFITYMVKGSRYEQIVCKFEDCFAPGEEDVDSYDAIITAVGPRQVLLLAPILSKARCPVILFENDSGLSLELRNLTKKKDIFFGIPDVITSNTAPNEILLIDPLSVVTEEGVTYIEEGASSLGGHVSYVSASEMKKQWMAKLYIHNTPHCIAAYLGSLKGFDFLHEGMQIKSIYTIVQGAMREMSQTIVKLYNLDNDFVDWYSDKELYRFSNILLHDPISRVAREPFRKLGLRDRLIGASQLSLSAGVIPKNIILGILTAFSYDQSKDEDAHIKILLNSLNPNDFLEIIIGLKSHEALFRLISSSWQISMKKLGEISK